MDRFSTRLATSIIADRHRQAGEDRAAAHARVAGTDASAHPADPSPASRLMHALARPFGLRSATN
jgi:hypothetical protein